MTGVGSRGWSAIYRGPDRRQSVPTSRRRAGGAPLAAVVAVVAACATSPWTARALTDVQLSLATDALRALAPALLFGAAMLWLARWRLTAEVQVASAAVALALVACLVFPLDLAAGLLFDDAGWQRDNPASWTVVTPMVFVLLWRGLHGSRVDSRVRPMALVAVMGGAVAVAFAAAVAVHRLGDLSLDPPAGRVQVAELAAAALWGVLAVHHARARRRGGRVTQLWAAVALALVGLACAYRAVAVTREVEWSFAAALVVTAAAALVLWSSLADLAEVYAHHGDRYVSVSTAAADAEQVLTREHEQHEEMVHDARSAIASVRAVSYHLGRWSEGLAQDLRADLATALTAELARLEALIERPAAPTEDFELAGCLEPLLRVHQQAGARVRVSIAPAWVRGSGVDLATAVENLLGNARRYAPGSVVDVWSDVVGRRGAPARRRPRARRAAARAGERLRAWRARVRQRGRGGQRARPDHQPAPGERARRRPPGGPAGGRRRPVRARPARGRAGRGHGAPGRPRPGAGGPAPLGCRPLRSAVRGSGRRGCWSSTTTPCWCTPSSWPCARRGARRTPRR